MTSIGTIGEQVDLYLRAGDTLGPFTLTLTDELGAAINLTGAALDAALSKDGDTGADIAMAATITDATNGKASLTLAPATTAGLAVGNDYFSVASTYVWRLRMTDLNGTKTTLMFGRLYIAPGVLP